MKLTFTLLLFVQSTYAQIGWHDQKLTDTQTTELAQRFFAEFNHSKLSKYAEETLPKLSEDQRSFLQKKSGKSDRDVTLKMHKISKLKYAVEVGTSILTFEIVPTVGMVKLNDHLVDISPNLSAQELWNNIAAALPKKTAQRSPSMFLWQLAIPPAYAFLENMIDDLGYVTFLGAARHGEEQTKAYCGDRVLPLGTRCQNKTTKAQAEEFLKSLGLSINPLDNTILHCANYFTVTGKRAPQANEETILACMQRMQVLAPNTLEGGATRLRNFKPYQFSGDRQ